MSVYLCGESAKDYFHFAQVVSVAIALGCTAFFFAMTSLVLVLCRHRSLRPQAAFFTVKQRLGNHDDGVLRNDGIISDENDAEKCEAVADAAVNGKQLYFPSSSSLGGVQVANVDHVAFVDSGAKSLNSTVPRKYLLPSPTTKASDKDAAAVFVGESSLFKLALCFNMGDGDPTAASEVCEQLRLGGFHNVPQLVHATLASLEAVTTDPIVLRKLCYMVEYAELAAEMDEVARIEQDHRESKPYG